MPYLFIAEKPSLMRDVEKVYQQHQKEIISKIGDSIRFIALAGHVCGLAMPRDYKDKGWDVKWEELPELMIPDQWRIKVTNQELYDRAVDAFNDGCDKLIVGTDSDNEGNGIFWLLAQKAGWQNVPTFRFFINDQTEGSILKALLNLTDFYKNSRDVRMTNCFLLRSRDDWAVGMNMSTQATVRAGTLIRAGRVKSFTTALVYENSKAIDDFVPSSSWYLVSDYGNFIGTLMDGKEPLSFATEEKAKAFAIEVSKNGVITDVQKKKAARKSPQYYNLSDIQVEAGAKYKFPPSKTLQIIQNLYEKRYLSYPRTNGRYISVEAAEGLPDCMTAAAAICGPFSIDSKMYTEILTNKRYVDDEAVGKESHTALMPTAIPPENLEEDEQKIYEMVARRVAASLYPPMLEERTVVTVDHDGRLFVAKGVVELSKGWTEVLPVVRKDVVLPALPKGQQLTGSIGTKEKQAKPPKRLTQSSLIQAMVNIGSHVKDKEFAKILKEVSGIGMPSTRSQIIKEIIDSGYVEEKKGKLYITKTGEFYVRCLGKTELISPEMTARLELIQKSVQTGDVSYEKAWKASLNALKRMLAQTKNIQPIPKAVKYGGEKMTASCPLCGGELILRKSKKGTQYVACQNEDCEFRFFNNIAGKALTANQMNALFSKGETGVISGFKKKAGGTFSAALKLNKEGKAEFDFSKNPKQKKK